jgi:hypothetical protein
MINLDQRANIRYHTVPTNKPLLIYEDHRYVLFVIWHAFRQGILNWDHPPDLLRFDYHDDGKEPLCGLERIQQINPREIEERAFLSFIEWELGCMDDDWIKTGMELGFFRHVVNLSVVKTQNFPNTINHYNDHSDNDHQIWNLRSFWEDFQYQGALVDLARRAELSNLWDILYWD